MSSYPLLRLRRGRGYPLLNGHPWLFSGAFTSLPRDLAFGAVVDVATESGEWLARGHLNADNTIAFRALTFDPDEAIDEDFYVRRIEAALAVRRLLPAQTNAYRLIHAEADYLPGLIADRYDRWLVTQFHTAGVERQREAILSALERALSADGVLGILTRDDVKAREREGLLVGGAGVARGMAPDMIEIVENGLRYTIDPLGGQKTGFFLDQREKRARVRELAPEASSLLNLFAYSGGFALAGLAGNPALATVNVDSSAPALDLARRNYILNGFDPDDERHEFVDSDVTRYLQRAVANGRRFDIVVVDPPAFAKSLAQKDRALRGYASLNALATQALAPNGLLLTCSCSGAVNAAEFEEAVRQGLWRAGRRHARLVASFGPSVDHPTLPGFSEDRYLKALLLTVE